MVSKIIRPPAKVSQEKVNQNVMWNSHSGSSGVIHLEITEKPSTGCMSCVYILDFLSKVSEHIASNKRWKLCSLTTPANICIYRIFLETRISDLHIAAFLMASVKRIFSAGVRFGRSRSSKVIDFGTNRKRVCDFLLVCHSILDPILHCFRDIARFYAHDPTPIPP